MRFLAVLVLMTGSALAQVPTHAISLLGEPALPANFTHFPYANPDAPKGGEVTLGSVGSFDSFNPFIVRGTPAADAARVYDTLMRPNADEAETSYAHLAASVTLSADKKSVTFALRPEAKFHDGTPVTADDVAWTFETLREKGRPNYRQYYADIDKVIVDGPHHVSFHFRTDQNRELPSILGQLPVLPKHWWASRDFTKPLTEPPLGSGPYRVGKVEFGRTLVMERVADYWGRNLPTARGIDNFGTRRTEYFRDSTVALEAFKAGQTDYRSENVAKDWATAYDFPAVQKGLVKKELLRHRLPTGMQGFAFNTRRKLFQDVRVREALASVFDFEWENANLFYGAYTRTQSYFSNSALASTGVPEGAELALLEPFRAKLPASLFTQPFSLPVTDGSGNNRAQLRRALELLKAAGWDTKERKLVNQQGEAFSFEILLDSPSYERIALPYVQWLARLGIEARVRTVDPAQYQRLTDSFDYDMTESGVPQSDSPGNEQVGFWSCDSAKSEGSDNLMGVCNPVVEALLPKVIHAANHAELLAATHALDRVLLAGWYMVPQWYLQSVRVAYWDRFGRVDMPLRSGIAFDAWWIDPAKAAATDAARRMGN